MYDLAVKNGSVWIDGMFHHTNVYVENGIIACVSGDSYPARKTIDAMNRLVLPGFIDPHVHFALNVGKGISADDFLSGSRTAAYGGVTTIIDFLDPADSAEGIGKAFAKRKEEARFCAVDYKFHATLKNPAGHVQECVARFMELGMSSVKIFTTYSDSGRRTYDPEIKELLRLSDRYGFLLEAHVENDEMIVHDPIRSHLFLPKSRPSASESSEALKMAGFVRECGGNFLMVHLSSGETLDLLRRMHPDLLNRHFFIESAPHYFFFDETKLSERDGFLLTMAPPLRSPAERDLLERLWDFVYVIGTDHCPFTVSEKNRRFLDEIPLGIPGVEHAFPLLYRRFGDSVIDKMTKNPAILHRLWERKGSITIGKDADLVVFSPDPFARIEQSHTKGDSDPYRGMDSGGRVETTILRGKCIVQNGHFVEGNGVYVGGPSS
jgi:dihydropyrimidinase